MASRRLVLIVEDDPVILRGLTDSFRDEGYETRSAVEGRLALSLALEAKPDLILLDIMIPGINGFEVCQSVRARDKETPIIIVSAKTREADIIRGLNLGADDYVTKPFRIGELHARVRRLLARQEIALAFGPFAMEVPTRMVRREGREVIELQPKEFDLLEFFLRHPHRALTREQILDKVWGDTSFVTDRSVDRCVNGLRRKLEEDPRRPRWFKTLHRIGYRFEP